MSNERDRRLGIVAKNLFSMQPSRTASEAVITTEPKTDSQLWHDIVQSAEKEPRVSFVSSRSKAILMYLRKTTPEFNISKVTAQIVEEGIAERWPELWKRMI